VKKVKTIIGGICLPLYLVWVYFNSIEGASTKYYWFDYFTVILFMLMSIYFWLDFFFVEEKAKRKKSSLFLAIWFTVGSILLFLLKIKGIWIIKTLRRLLAR
jgi:hypothetical protein